MKEGYYNTCRQRIEWVDIARGIGVFLVILGHMPRVPGIIRLWIFSYHMPLFFVLSGYFANPVKQAGIEFFKKKVIQLLRPYVIYSVTFMMLDFFILQSGVEHLKISFMRFLLGQGGYDILWFLFSLFLVEVMFNFIYNISGKFYSLIICIIVVLGYILSMFRLGNTFKLAPSLFAIGFYALGYLIKVKINFCQLLNKISWFIFMAIFNLVGFAICINLRGIVLDLNSNRSFDLIIVYVVALSGTFCVCAVAKFIENWKIAEILKYIGRNSLYFYPLTAYVPTAIVIIAKNYGIEVGTIVKFITKLIGFAFTTAIIQFKRVIYKEAKKSVTDKKIT